MKCQHVNDLGGHAEMAGSARKMKLVTSEKPVAGNVDMLTKGRQLAPDEFGHLLDYLTQPPMISLEPEERPRDSLSAPLIPTCNRQLSLMELKEILNTQIPTKWRKQINEIVW